MSASRQELLKRLGRLAALVNSEMTLKGAELERAIAEKEALASELESLMTHALAESAPGGDEELAVAVQAAKWAADLSVKGARVRRQLAQTGAPKAEKASPRLDLIS